MPNNTSILIFYLFISLLFICLFSHIQTKIQKVFYLCMNLDIKMHIYINYVHIYLILYDVILIIYIYIYIDHFSIINKYIVFNNKILNLKFPCISLKSARLTFHFPTIKKLVFRNLLFYVSS